MKVEDYKYFEEILAFIIRVSYEESFSLYVRRYIFMT